MIGFVVVVIDVDNVVVVFLMGLDKGVCVVCLFVIGV